MIEYVFYKGFGGILADNARDTCGILMYVVCKYANECRKTGTTVYSVTNGNWNS